MKTRYRIAAHPIQQAIMDEVCGKGIDELSLREIGERIGVKANAPQQVKHHLNQMLKYGFLDLVGGRYRVGSLLKAKLR